MPLFMDMHELDGAVVFDGVAGAHLADLQVQHRYEVRYVVGQWAVPVVLRGRRIGRHAAAGHASC